MPREESDDELDVAFKRYGKRLKEKEDELQPTKDAELRARVEEISAEFPHRAKLVEGAENTLQKLKEEFHIIIEQPTTLPDILIFLLARRRAREHVETTISAADLYTQLHETPDFKGVSPKAFRKALQQLEKKDALMLTKTDETLLIRLRQEFLSDDEAALLDLAARKGGTITLEQAMVLMQWPQVRVRTALEALMVKQMVIQKKGFLRGTRFQVSETR